ncbi:transcriptional regulator GcvA [Pseudoalteromonas fenneropenaei]|uniref:Transcriptional regulator GcvA n=1 Tax=Pseudoalteromonas fenneropenaei TaxID=1737459 RepID=A0ABV7CGH5_9GAMM
MSRRLPPLNALKAFEAAARHLSFTKAAEELYVTQAAVSHQIKTLEDHLGLKLFLRKNRSLLLTEEGQAYFLDIKEIFSQLIDATDKLLARGAKGSLTVSLTPSFAIQWLVPRLSRFHEAHPEIDVRIKAQDHDENSLTDDVDVAIYYGRGNWSGVQTHKLHTEYLVPLCSPMLLTGPRPLNTPNDLANHTLLHDTTRRPWKLWMKTAGVRNVQVNTGPIFSHSSMVLQAAVHGQGVALGNSVLARPELDAGRLVIPFSHHLESKNAYYLVLRESQTELGKIVAFKDWMLSMVELEQEIA